MAYRRTLKRYGLSEAEYEALVTKAAGCCAVCGQGEKKLVIDHDHDTGKVRGLVCMGCNTFLGFLENYPELFDQATRYLATRGGK